VAAWPRDFLGRNRAGHVFKTSPLSTRKNLVEFGSYEAAALFPEPAVVVERAWKFRLRPKDLYDEIEKWARRFNSLGYGDPPCLTLNYNNQRNTLVKAL